MIPYGLDPYNNSMKMNFTDFSDIKLQLYQQIPNIIYIIVIY